MDISVPIMMVIYDIYDDGIDVLMYYYYYSSIRFADSCGFLNRMISIWIPAILFEHNLEHRMHNPGPFNPFFF